MKLLQTISLFILLFLIVACNTADEATPTTAVSDNTTQTDPTDPPPTGEPTRIPPTETAEATATDEPTAIPEPTATDEPAAVPEPTNTPEPTPFVWAAAISARDNLSRDDVTDNEQRTWEELKSNIPLERDDVALAIAYNGLTEQPNMEGTAVTEPLTAGTRRQINILNIDLNTVNNPEFTLLHVSEHAYFWFDSTPGLTSPEDATLIEMGESFDQIYEQDRAIFGNENSPGIDGDPRIHIMNASPLTVCDVTEANSHTCGLGGYYASNNTLPVTVDIQSNEMELFVMNGSFFGSTTYLDILAHEFRHMIEDNYDANDLDWEIEGSAMLAEDLLGFPNDPIARGNAFLGNPDQQLNRWTDGNTLPYYGQGYLMNRYIYNRLGSDLYMAFATHPDNGFDAVDAIAVENGLDFNGQSIWLDWLTALAIHSEPNAPAEYALREGITTAAMETINNFPANYEETVNQYAVDYYKLFGDGSVTLEFTGSNHAQLLKVLPASGETMWLANRANFSQVQLTREFDLTAVDTATLEYVVFHEIEKGYDFAYLTISTDGGVTWQGLESNEMQGLEINDDPSETAFTDRYYTGRSQEWLKASADLTPYAGQVVQIRFEYVTDPILTFGGIAIDNISIPEIGFYDDTETDAGWTANGFVRATGYVPQQWHLQLITFVDDAPVIKHLLLDENNTVSIDFSLDNDGGGRPILVIAASAPMTLEAAHYAFEIR